MEIFIEKIIWKSRNQTIRSLWKKDKIFIFHDRVFFQNISFDLDNIFRSYEVSKSSCFRFLLVSVLSYVILLFFTNKLVGIARCAKHS